MHSVSSWSTTSSQDRSMGNIFTAVPDQMEIDDDNSFDLYDQPRVVRPAASRTMAFVDLATEESPANESLLTEDESDDECVESSQQPLPQPRVERVSVGSSVVDLVDDGVENLCDSEAALTVSLSDIVEPLESSEEEEEEEDDKYESEELDDTPASAAICPANEPTEPEMSSSVMATPQPSSNDEVAVIEIDDDDDEDNKNGTSPADVSDEPIQQLLIYPPTGVGGISINTEDFMCLAKEEYLNDIIIDFYLKYVFAEVLSDAQRERSHIFSTFFYKRLVSSVASRRRGDRSQGQVTAAALERHSHVKKWTKHVNLFEKDLVFVPINEHSHWYLAVICFPALIGPVARYGGNPIKSLPSIVPVNRPCILILDSMNTAGHKATINTLQEYLACEYQAKFGVHNGGRSFTNETFPGHTLPVPQQDNYSDCGLFVLQFVEAFFDDPIRDFQMPIKRLANWFDCMAVLRKREEIALLLSSLVCQHNPGKVGLLPQLEFPTKDGQLV